MRAHPPRVHVSPKRPSFTPDGKTDATEYAWFTWKQDRNGDYGPHSGIVMLDTENVDTRRRKKKQQPVDKPVKKPLMKRDPAWP